MIPPRYKRIALTVLTILLATGAAMAENLPITPGTYSIQGWSPGHDATGPPDYSGQATLSHWNQAWRYRGNMDNHIYAGAGLYDKQGHTLSLSFTSGDGTERGVTVLKNNKGVLEGNWVLDTGDQGTLGHEIWTLTK